MLTKHVDGKEFPGGVVRCLRCNHAVEHYATSPDKVARGAAFKLSKECPRRESNFYKPDGDTKQATKDWRRAMKAEKRAATRKGGKA